MWGNIPLFDSMRFIYFLPGLSNCDNSIFSRRRHDHDDIEFIRNLKDIRKMGIDLVDSNHKIGEKISNANLCSPSRLWNIELCGQKSNDNKKSSCCVGDPFWDDFYNGCISSDESSDTSSCNSSRHTFSETSDDSCCSQTLYNSFDIFDENNSFDSIVYSPNADGGPLAAMVNNIFGYDKIYQYPTRGCSAKSQKNVTSDRTNTKCQNKHDIVKQILKSVIDVAAKY